MMRYSNDPSTKPGTLVSLIKRLPQPALVAFMVLAVMLLSAGIRLLGVGAFSGTPVSLTTLGAAYTQNFDTLVNTGTSSSVPTGWGFAESGTNANTTYTAGTGSSNAGDTYSFGAASSTERAFGGLLSGSLTPTIGACFTNNTGSTVTSLDIAYTGEMWRAGVTNRNAADRLDFQYSLTATSITDGAATWIDVDNLDFNSPNIMATAGALDGNAAANRTAISFSITSLSIPNGSTFFIRWNDFNISSSDDGLAIDDFSITPRGAGVSQPSLSINDVTMAEGNSGTTSFNFTVSLTSPAGAGGVTFDIATADGTAQDGNPIDRKSVV